MINILFLNYTYINSYIFKHVLNNDEEFIINNIDDKDIDIDNKLKKCDIIICSSTISNINIIDILKKYKDKLIINVTDNIEFTNRVLYNLYIDNILLGIGCVSENNNNIKFPLYIDPYDIDTCIKINEINYYVTNINIDNILNKKFCQLLNNYDTSMIIYNKLINISNISHLDKSLIPNINNLFNFCEMDKVQKNFIFSICSEKYLTESNIFISEILLLTCISGNIPIYYGKLDSIDTNIFNINRIICYDPTSKESIENTYIFIKDLLTNIDKLYNFYKQPVFVNNAIDTIEKIKLNLNIRLKTILLSKNNISSSLSNIETINEIINESNSKPNSELINEIFNESNSKPNSELINEIINESNSKPNSELINETINESNNKQNTNITQKIVFMTFETNKKNYNNILEITNSAKDFNIFYKIYGMSDYDLKDISIFWNENEEFIKSFPDNYGNYIWKSFLLKSLMNELNENDIIIYVDCKYKLNIDAKNTLLHYINLVNLHNSLTFNIDKLNNDNLDIFKDINISNNSLNYVSNDIIFLKNTTNNINFLNDLYNLCKSSNYQYIINDTIDSIKYKTCENILINKYNIYSITNNINIYNINTLFWLKHNFNIVKYKDIKTNKLNILKNTIVSNIIISIITTNSILITNDFNILINNLFNQTLKPKYIVIHNQLSEDVEPYNIINNDYPNLIIMCYKSILSPSLVHLNNIINIVDKLDIDDKIIFINDDLIINNNFILLYELGYQLYNCDAIICNNTNDKLFWDNYNSELLLNNTYSFKYKVIKDLKYNYDNVTLDKLLYLHYTETKLYVCGLNIFDLDNIQPNTSYCNDNKLQISSKIPARYLLHNISNINYCCDNQIDFKYLNDNLIIITITNIDKYTTDFIIDDNKILLNDNITKKYSLLLSTDKYIKFYDNINYDFDLIQTNKNNIVEYNQFYSIMTILNYLPNLNYVFINDDDIDNMIKSNDHLYSLYNKLNDTTTKIDLFKAWYLYTNAGIYISSKYILLQPLNTYLDKDEIFTHPNFIYSKNKNNIILKEYLLKMCDNIKHSKYNTNYLEISNSELLSTFNKCTKIFIKDNKYILCDDKILLKKYDITFENSSIAKSLHYWKNRCLYKT